MDGARRSSRLLVSAVVLAAFVTALLVVAAPDDEPAEAPRPTEQPPAEVGPSEPPPIIDPSEFTNVLTPDSIPAIDEPMFAAVDDVGILAPREPVLAMERGGEARAYPLRILMWHEIVNDEIGGVPVAVTYCPLCNIGIAFRRPIVGGELLDFGTSGKLYHSNLVMYDRQSESYWPQATGQAVSGPLTGTQLELLPIQIVSWSDFVDAHPDGLVLSEPGTDRPYGENPYVGYDEEDRPFLYRGEIDPRLPAKERVLGVAVGDDRLAFPYSQLREGAVGDWSAVKEQIGGRPVVVFWKQGTVSALDAPIISESRAVGAVGAFSPSVGGRILHFEARADGLFDLETGSRWDVLGRAVEGRLAGRALERLVATDSYWFDWAAFFPSTGVFVA